MRISFQLEKYVYFDDYLFVSSCRLSVITVKPYHSMYDKVLGLMSALMTRNWQICSPTEICLQEVTSFEHLKCSFQMNIEMNI